MFRKLLDLLVLSHLWLADLWSEVYYRVRGYPVAPEPEYPLPWCCDPSGYCGVIGACRFNCWDIDA